MRVGNTRAAKQILSGGELAPKNETTREEVDDLLCTSSSSNRAPGEELDRQRKALQAARAKFKGVGNVHTRGVRRRARILNIGAAPGPSGWRNIHL